MKRVTLVTGHYWKSKRKAGFHWLADAYRGLGWEVLFFTAPISFLSKTAGNYRFDYPIKEEKAKFLKKDPSLYSFIHYTPWHVVNLRSNLLNTITHPFTKLYEKYDFSRSHEFIEKSDLIIFESTAALLLFDKFKRLNSKAKFVYRMSDNLRMLKVHPSLIKYEESIIEKFDLVSVPSKFMYDSFKEIKNLELNYHGINKSCFDKSEKNPFKKLINFVFVGNDKFDREFLGHAMTVNNNWNFHIIGPISKIPKKANVITYGEMPFQETVSYLQHATAGLHTVIYKEGAESLTDSLKVHQYTYCQLPIIAPEFLKTNRKHVFYYHPSNPASIKEALIHALNYENHLIDKEQVCSWEDLAQTLCS